MAVTVGGVLASYLEANRDDLNRRVADARRASASFEPEAFAEAVRTLVAPVVDAVEAHGDGFAPRVAETLVGVALDLCAADRLGGAVHDGWATLLPALAGQLSADPHGVVAGVTNALVKLEQAQGARPQQWIDLLLAAAPRCPTPDVLLRAGQVAAWRAGMARYREGALDLAATLDPELVATVLAVPPGASTASVAAGLLDHLRADPWFDPSLDARRVGPVRVGTFRGVGGAFLRPPMVALDASRPDQVVAFDGEGAWLVFADAFGSGLVRAPDAIAVVGADEHAAPPASLASIVEITSWVRVRGGLAATSALSHSVIHVPDPEPAA